MMEETHKTKGCTSTTTALHLEEIENNFPSTTPGDEPYGLSKFLFHDPRRRNNSSMSKRISSTSNANKKNEYGEGIMNEPTSTEGYYKSNETPSFSLISSLSQTEHNKYSRRKKRKYHGRDRLFLMMVALVVLSCSFAVYLTSEIIDTSNNGVHRPTDGFGFVVHHRSMEVLPRIISLNADQFGSFQDNPHRMGDKFLANLVEVEANKTVVFFGDLSLAEIEPELEQEGTTGDSQKKPEAPPSVTTKEEKKCLPMAKWMTSSFPNCNSVHEIDMHQGVMTRTFEDEDDLKFLGQGWFRDTWKYVNENLEGSPAVVLKTLRIEREFIEEYFDLHRRDAVAMERLTFSPYVVNVHGYCGQSAINELAEGILGGKINNLEKLNRKLRGKEKDSTALFLKLQLATKVSLGLAHIHNIHVSDEIGSRSKSVESLLYEQADSAHSTTGFGNSVATMAHYDINPRNIAVMNGGEPKLNDFNIAEFLTYDPETNHTCGFRSRLHEPWWRAPEEMDLTHETFVDEKVDVYALGEVLFHILTTHGPRGKMKKWRMDEVRALVKQGIPPVMWEPYASDKKLKKNPIVKAFMEAMDLCFEKDPKKRGTSIQVARVLHKALKKEEASRQVKKEEAQK